MFSSNFFPTSRGSSDMTPLHFCIVLYFYYCTNSVLHKVTFNKFGLLFPSVSGPEIDVLMGFSVEDGGAPLVMSVSQSITIYK